VSLLKRGSRLLRFPDRTTSLLALHSLSVRIGPSRLRLADHFALSPHFSGAAGTVMQWSLGSRTCLVARGVRAPFRGPVSLMRYAFAMPRALLLRPGRPRRLLFYSLSSASEPPFGSTRSPPSAGRPKVTDLTSSARPVPPPRGLHNK